jgi:hypothetical protein
MKNKIFFILIPILSFIESCSLLKVETETNRLDDYRHFTYVVDTINCSSSKLVLFYEKNFYMPIIINDSCVNLLKTNKFNARYFIEKELGYYFLAEDEFSLLLSFISSNGLEMEKYFKLIENYDFSRPIDTIEFSKNEKRIIYELNYNFLNKRFLVLMLKIDPSNFNNPLISPSNNKRNPYYIKVLCPMKN